MEPARLYDWLQELALHPRLKTGLTGENTWAINFNFPAAQSTYTFTAQDMPSTKSAFRLLWALSLDELSIATAFRRLSQAERHDYLFDLLSVANSRERVESEFAFGNGKSAHPTAVYLARTRYFDETTRQSFRDTIMEVYQGAFAIMTFITFRLRPEMFQISATDAAEPVHDKGPSSLNS